MKIETDEQLQECIKAVEDALERGVIEVRMNGVSRWIEPESGSLICGAYHLDYRVKPKPLEVTIIVGSNMALDIVDPEDAEQIAADWDKKLHEAAPHRVAIMREVTDD